MKQKDIELTEQIMLKNELDPRTISSIIEEMKNEMKAEEEEKVPRPKKQFCFVVSDPEGELEGKDLVGWVVQLFEEESPYEAISKLHKLGYEFNQTRNGRRIPVKSVGEICEVVPQRLYKECECWVKTKEPILVVRTDNVLPLENVSLSG